MTILEYDDLALVPDAVFNGLIKQDIFYFSRPFLAAFAAHNPVIRHAYFVISEYSAPVAIAVIQQLQVRLETATAQLPLHARLARSVHCTVAGRTAQIAVCGNIFLSGNYGVFVKNAMQSRDIYDMIARFLQKSVIAKRASVLFFKDFNDSQKEQTVLLADNKFTAFQVDPNMVLSIQPSWQTVNDYLAQLKSKYRIKVNRANSLSDSLTIKSLSASDIIKNSQRLNELITNVTERALVNTVNLNMQTYAALKKAFPETVLFKGYYEQENLVAFAVAFVHHGTVDAHFIGMDYAKNKKFALYPRILNDYIKEAIETRSVLLNLGRTSSEIKSTLGAIPEPLHCYVRHKRTVANLIFRPFVGQLKATPYKQHKPLKELKH
jgi:hypothetical protein